MVFGPDHLPLAALKVSYQGVGLCVNRVLAPTFGTHTNIRGLLEFSATSTLTLVIVAPAEGPWCDSINLLIVLVD